MTRNTPCIKQDDYQHYFELLSRTVEDLNSFPPEGDIYALIAVTLRQIAPRDTIILVNSFNPDTKTITLHTVEGLGVQQPDVEAILGRPLKGLSFSIPEQVLPFMHTGECNEIPGGIAELTFGSIPPEVCTKIEAMPFFGKVYSAGISWKGKLKGAATIILPPKTVLKNKDLITLFIRQVAGFLSRREAETSLKNNLAELTRTEHELRKNEEKYRILAESAKDIIFIVTRDMTISYVNSAMEASFGISPRDAVGKNINQVFSHDIAELQNRSLQQVFTKGESVIIEMGISALDGLIWYNTQLVPLFNPLHEVDQVMGISRDITSRKETEKKLFESEERFRIATQSITDIIWDWDITTGTLRWFGDIDQILGYAPGELPRTLDAWAGVIHPDDSDRIRQEITRHLDSDERFDEEYRVITKNGTTRYWRDQASIVHDSTGKPVRMIGAITDNTERKIAEKRLQESETQLRATLESTADGILAVDTKGNVLQFNRRFQELWRIPRSLIEHYDDKILLDFVIDQLADPEAFLKRVQSLNNSDAVDMDTLIFKDDRVFERYSFPMIMEGIRIGRVWSFRDITKRKKAEEALRESENRYRSFVEKFRGIAYQATSNWIPVFFHGDVEEITGYTEMDFVSGNPRWDQVIYPEDLEVINHRDGEKLITVMGYSIQREYRIIRRDGQLRWISDFIQNQKDDNGEFLLSGIITDITQRKTIEEALIQKTAEIDGFFSVSLDLLCIANTDGYFLLLNPAWEKILGYQREELMAKQFLEFVHPEDLQATKDAILTLVNQKLVISFINRYRCKDGTYRWIEWCSAPAGKVIYAAARDITERKRAEDALKESEERFRISIEKAPEAILLFDVNQNRYVDANASAENLFGCSRQQLLDSGPQQFYKPDQPDNRPISETVDEHRRQVLTGEMIMFERFIRNARSEDLVLEIRLVQLQSDDHRLIRSSYIDITNRKLMESEIRSLNTVLEQRVEQRTAQLNTSLEDKIILLREVHHRVKNNLQIIISLLNLQARYIEDEKTKQVFKESQNRVKAMSLVHEKLYQSTEIAKIDLDNYIRYLGNSLFQSYGMSDKGIVLTTRIQEINLDLNTAIPIGLIMHELISNSLKYAFPDGKNGEISIAIQRKEARLTIFFKDTGVGIPADLNWRNAESLGLRLVISLVEQLDGTIELDRSSGTMFTIIVNEIK